MNATAIGGDVPVFTKTDCYGNSIGLHCVKHDGWNYLCYRAVNVNYVVSPYETPVAYWLLAFCIIKEVTYAKHRIDPAEILTRRTSRTRKGE